MTYKVRTTYTVVDIDHANQTALLKSFSVTGAEAPKTVSLAQLVVFDIDEDRVIYFLSDRGKIYSLKRVDREPKIGDSVEIICPLRALAEQA